MSYAYGTMIVAGDYEADLEALCDVLNGLNFDVEGEFRRYGSRIGVAQSNTQYPTVYPSQDVILKDGRKWPLDEAPEELVREWEDGQGQGIEAYSLEALSNMIGPL